MTGLYRASDRVSLGRAREAEYQCLHCPRPVWRAGGATALARHITTTHPDCLCGDFPRVGVVDEAGVVDFDGAPATVHTDTDGLIRSRPIIPGALGGTP